MWPNVSSQSWDKKANPERSLSFPSAQFHTNKSHSGPRTDGQKLAHIWRAVQKPSEHDQPKASGVP